MKLLETQKSTQDLSTGNGVRSVITITNWFPNGVVTDFILGVFINSLGTGSTRNVYAEGQIDSVGLARTNFNLVRISTASEENPAALPTSGRRFYRVSNSDALDHSPLLFKRMIIKLDENYDTGSILFIAKLYNREA